MRATVTGTIRLHRPPPDLADAVRSALTIPNPEYLEAQKQMRATSGIDAALCYALRVGEDMLVPRGYGADLRALCQSRGVELDCDWTGLARGDVLDARSSVEPRPYQRAAVEALLHGRQGVVVAPTGAGKTIIGCLGIVGAGVSSLIVVHTLDLLQQWRQQIRRVIGVEPGQVGGGVVDWQPVTVATVQTLHRLGMAEVSARGAGIGLVIHDEVHRQAASTWWDVCSWLPCLYRWGLTATPERADGLTQLLWWGVGPLLYEVPARELLDAGHLAKPRVVQVHTGWRYPAFDEAAARFKEVEATREGWPVKRAQMDKQRAFQALQSALIEDADRNARIVDLVRREVDAGHQVLVLSGRVDHCEALCALLRAAGVDAEVVTGKTAKKAREGIMGRLRDGTLPAACCTQLADEGLDAPGLDRLVVAFPTRNKRQATQRRGRIMRPGPGKQPVVYDLVDDVGVLRGQAAARLRAYRADLGDVSLTAERW